ncbi:sigma E protease regulator RseP [Bermanella marisrubri]|uniref:Zinc metalloprotease n=1 Tax=Bermanella marisrubri TaxID=207949 RepID=Q1N1W7_9GAMM|nr:sigma E protease regulator RseP [Bermanella marisrubri]EAT12164.1 hypothetical protein RED65_04040 [Oceanobacter sp. RED65] [Bermanella marisrubri]QIZ83640.1 sigma E protease regulator RseP [Bermanella marisrubri]
MSVITSILALIVTLGILVTIHEYGHYWVARRCGVKVLRFSVGFGKVLFSRTDKHGTEFAIAAIPLGGYVKMLDEREGEVPEHELDSAFNRKTVWQRMAIVLAGPAANIIFAIFAYWLMFMTGVTSIKPVVGVVTEPAISAGIESEDVITAIDGNTVSSWQQVNFRLIDRIGDTGDVMLELNGSKQSSINIEKWLHDVEEPYPLEHLGIAPFRPSIPAVIDQVQDGLAADQAGIKVGDEITSANGQEIEDWSQLVEIIKSNPNQPVDLIIARDGNEQPLMLIPGSKQLSDEQQIGFAGIAVKQPELPQDFIVRNTYGLIESIAMALDKTWQMSVMTLDSLGKMIQGLLSVKNLSGPITIAKVANASAEAGFEAFIGFLAYISIMLAIVNLLPIPVLDGGHFLYYVIEAIKGSPVSEKVQIMGIKIGMLLLFTVMFIAIFNDISRI